MSLFTKLFEAVHSWRRRRGGLKARKRADLAMEQLDHRQLLAVNFTGNVPIDFPATQVPGVVVVPPGPNSHTPQIPTLDANGNPEPGTLATVISKSGFEIDQLRVSYTSSDDTLSVGLAGPPNGRDGRQVIAGDSDNNGNSGTVNPNVTAIDPAFMDPPDMGGTKTYGIFLDLKDPNAIDVVAGFPQGGQFDTTPKAYQVAKPVSSALQFPTFDQNNLLPQFTGSYFLENDPNHPNFELQITHFSQLYQQITGNALTPQTQFSIGAFGVSNQNGGISDEFFQPSAVTLGTATPATPGIALAKTTNGVAAPLQPGPTVAAGSTVTWTYLVGNTGNDPLKNVSVVDNGGNSASSADSFKPTFASGDTNGNGLLDPGEIWVFTATGTAKAGQYENQAVVTAAGVNSGQAVTSTAVSHYFAPTPPPPPTVCSPTIFVNPHESNHVNTAHASAIRVNVLGSSGFDPTTLIPSTVKFGDPATIDTTGASPILNFESNVNHDGFPDETFVFNGLDVTLPPGVTTAELIGTTTSGQMIASSVTVFNRDSTYYKPAQISKQEAAWLAYDKKNGISTADGAVPPSPMIPKAAQQRAASMAISDLYDPFKGKKVPQQVNAAGIGTAQPASAAVAPVVSIPTRNGKGVKASKANTMTVKLAGSAAPKGPSILQLIGGGA